jgi:hypothetical protein
MTTYKLYLRRFRGEIPKNGSKTPRRIDEVLDLENDGDTFNVSLTKTLVIPSFKPDTRVPQWGFLVDVSEDEDLSFPVLVMVLSFDKVETFNDCFDRRNLELSLGNEVRKRFPQPHRRRQK